MTFSAVMSENFTFHVEFQARTHEIAFPAVSEILCVLHISKIKDIRMTFIFLYISKFYILSTFTRQRLMTFPVISEISCVVHISNVKDM